MTESVSLTGRSLLVAAPLTLLIARTLNVPWPGSGEPAKSDHYVQQIAANPGRSDLGAALLLLSAILLIPAVLCLGSLARPRNPRLATAGTALTVIGCVGCAAVAAVSVISGQIVRHSPAGTAREIVRTFNTSIPTIDVPVLLGTVGYLLLGIALYRSPHTPRLAAVLIGIGGPTTMITSEGPIKPLLLTATVILLAGHSWLAITLFQTPAPTPHSRTVRPEPQSI
jgi:hypothetical protein